MKEKTLLSSEQIVNHLQTSGFMTPNAKMYGGVSNSWEFGPYGVEVKRRIKELWWRFFIDNSMYNVGYESAIVTHPKVLSSSGHLDRFFDWTIKCLSCQATHRVDKVVDEGEIKSFLLQEKEKEKFVFLSFVCPDCSSSSHSSPQGSSLLLSTNFMQRTFYLRPETCQGVFTSFPYIRRVLHRPLPFGVGQIGKSFRNEVTLRHGVFRMREFEQMELEFFCSKEEKKEWLGYWVEKAWVFVKRLLFWADQGNSFRLEKKEVSKEELPHYAQKTIDFFYNFSFGWGEICSHSDRGGYDLQRHDDSSLPQTIELSFGVERLFLAALEEGLCFREEKKPVLSLFPLISPFFLAVVFLHVNLKEKTEEIYVSLLKENFPFSLTLEQSCKIGKAYYYQDSIGTFFCLTVDQQTQEDQTVTIRYRDTKEQFRIEIEKVAEWLWENYKRYSHLFFS